MGKFEHLQKKKHLCFDFINKLVYVKRLVLNSENIVRICLILLSRYP